MSNNKTNIIDQIWEKALVVEGIDPNLYRKDSAGAWISRTAFGDAGSIFGWEIDHIYPVSLGGDNNIINLRPMNCGNNRSKGNSYPYYVADVVSDGNTNIYRKTQCTVNIKLQTILNQLYQNDFAH
ncbi:MAG: hypothetical protein II852_13140 [Bacteroidales bacterium]|nr:hypothetical protein [Bacteroidales bacterium]